MATRLVTKAISDDNLAKISDFVIIKQTPKVIKQNPAPGTPVLQGMTIEVQAVSLSDVPYHVLDVQAPPSVKYVPIADFEKLVDTDETLKAAVKAGTIPEKDLGPIVESMNRNLAQSGLTSPVSPNDAQAIVKSLGSLGLFEF